MTTKAAVDLPYIIAKVRAMRSAMYEGDRLAALNRARTVPELAQRLGFGEIAAGHLQVERLLTARHVADLVKVARLLDGRPGALCDWLLARYQLENLKVTLRFWAAGEPVERLAGLLVEVPGFPALAVEELTEARDLSGFIRLVQEPIFARGLSEGLDYWQSEGRTFLAEAGLDAAYFRELHEQQAALGAADRAATRRVVGADIDIYNLLLVTRSQVNYHLQLEDVQPFVVAGGTITRSSLLEARGETPGAILSKLPSVAALHLGDVMPESLPELEDALLLRLHGLANRRYYQSMLDLGAPVAFYYLKRNELANLVRVVEGLRYELQWSDVAKRLVPPLTGETG